MAVIVSHELCADANTGDELRYYVRRCDCRKLGDRTGLWRQFNHDCRH